MRRWGYIKGYPTAPTEAIPPMPLTDAAIRRAKPSDKPQKITDGGGLYLYLTPTGARSWRWKYRFAGKEKPLSIGLQPDQFLSRLPASSWSIPTTIAPASVALTHPPTSRLTGGPHFVVAETHDLRHQF